MLLSKIYKVLNSKIFFTDVIIFLLVTIITAGIVYYFNAPKEETLSSAIPIRDLAIRSAPNSTTAIVSNVKTGTPIIVLARNKQSNWILIQKASEPNQQGWLPIDGVDPLPQIDTLPIATVIPGITKINSSSTITKEKEQIVQTNNELPDLSIEDVFVKNNKLVVVLSNVGEIDVIGAIHTSIDGSEPKPVDIKTGEPLRPAEKIQIVLENEYVQRRGSVHISAYTDPPIYERNIGNNEVKMIVSPDLPNDLSISDVNIIKPQNIIRVSIKNKSPIPITGSATISVRSVSDRSKELYTIQPYFSLGPEESVPFDINNKNDINFNEIEILMSTSAINDSNSDNNISPRIRN
tara:strand:- start:29214 stop:30263 length:1050 start_codon:yes stop_codon:yes gene_type:complete